MSGAPEAGDDSGTGPAESDTEIDASADVDISTADTMRERADESRLKLWLLLKANRVHLAGALAVVVFCTFVAVGSSVDGFVATLQSGDTKGALFSTMLGAIITGTTLVVTISQLVISQENGPLGDQHRRMSNTMDFRDYVGEMYDEPTPVDPSAFLRRHVHEVERRAKALREAVAGSGDDDLRTEVDEFTDSVTGNAEAVREQLAGASFGTFDVLFAALNFNYAWKIFQVERIGSDHEAAIDDEIDDRLTDLRTTLTMFGPAREHVKTLYFQWALVDLSQYILYASVPALVVTGSLLAFLGSGPIPGTTLGVENVLWVVGAGFTASLVPFLLLVVYISRIAVVAKRTLAIGPLILRDSQR
ncbi:hypothetical protein C475_12160 [Halosimplex carlsbadense 2-9-1]|uniref:Uncharacterized protein n=1 Tax=Halosimplex carlsbadense 2-9-1 TaxID=797114 RepID=M0CP39_9EURY|nr:hypothetical protein [Halosimplex carlsbadense]ELZ24991.1 hypothetical protein C475_12160 [Halosimplex carlsbadense 2-9-1]